LVPKNSLVSIIIPTYNRAHLIPRAIQSVLDQTHSDWELIIVDDGSIDNTSEVVAGFVHIDNRVKYFPQTQNRGGNFCRNFGIEKAQGDFICFLDSDDYFDVKKLSLQVQKFEEEPSLDIVVGNTRIESGKERFKFHSREIKPSQNLAKEFIRKDISWPICAPLFKLSFIRQFEGFDEGLSSSQDFDFFARIVLANPKVAYVDEILATVINIYVSKTDVKVRHARNAVRNMKNRIWVRFRLSRDVWVSRLSLTEKLHIQWYLSKFVFGSILFGLIPRWIKNEL
jgi:glycosyltransferase involved in cell wall biosynthesis